MPKYANFNKSRFPVVIIDITEHIPTWDELKDYLKEFDNIINEHSDIVVLLNVNKAKFLPAEMRIHISNWMKEKKPIFQKNVRGLGYINSSMIASLMIKGIFLVNKPPVDFGVFKTEEEAITWSSKQLHAVRSVA